MTALGAVAQMGERCNRTAEVRGSIPLGSTKHKYLISRTNLRLTNVRYFRTLRGMWAQHSQSLGVFRRAPAPRIARSLASKVYLERSNAPRFMLLSLPFIQVPVGQESDFDLFRLQLSGT